MILISSVPCQKEALELPFTELFVIHSFVVKFTINNFKQESAFLFFISICRNGLYVMIHMDERDKNKWPLHTCVLKGNGESD